MGNLWGRVNILDANQLPDDIRVESRGDKIVIMVFGPEELGMNGGTRAVTLDRNVYKINKVWITTDHNDSEKSLYVLRDKKCMYYIGANRIA